MAKTLANTTLSTATARRRLAVAAKPYYTDLEADAHLGYRKGKTGGAWLVRLYIGGGKYRLDKVGLADDTSAADGVTILDYRQAQKAARERAAVLRRQAAGADETARPSKGPYTVRQCVDDHLKDLDQRGKSGTVSRYFAEAWIFPKLGDLEASKLTPRRIRDWLSWVAESPARLRGSRDGKQNIKTASNDLEEDKRRRRSTANRGFTILRAALNAGFHDGHIPSDAAWRRVKPFRGVDGARQRYLTVDECRRLINASDFEFRPLVRAALATGARYGELTALCVGDFNPDSDTVHIRQSKAGQERHVYLNDEGCALFDEISVGRPTAAPMFTRAGREWRRTEQARPMRAACGRAGIAPPVGFHVLRHSYASLAIMAGLPLHVLAANLGHSDTRMVERHYGHMAQSYVAEAVRTLAPSFGTTPKTTVRRARRAEAEAAR